jgi:hypothetical protein
MERRLIALVAIISAATLGLSASVFAQEPAGPPVSREAPAQVSDAEIQTFADIYVDLQETANKYEAAMSGAKNEQEARNVQTRMQEESLATVARRGWTAERYLTVAEAINANPALLQKARRLIEK